MRPAGSALFLTPKHSLQLQLAAYRLGVQTHGSSLTIERSMPMTAEIEQVESKLVYQNRWMSVREDAIRRADGTPGLYGVVEKSDFAIVAAVQDQHIYLVEQYRYPVGARHWELPQGSWEADMPDPLVLARAELLEETGVRAGTMVQVGRLYPSYGFCTQACDVFLASDLVQGEAQREPEEQGLIARRFSLDEVKAMICRGEIMDAPTVAVMGLLALQGLV